MFGWSQKSRLTSGTGGTRRYWWFCLINFRNSFSINVSEVEKSTADIPVELPCLGDFENPDQLKVQEVLEGTDDSVLWIFEISSIFMFSRSNNPLLAFLLNYPVQVILEIQVNFRYRGTDDCVLYISGHFFTVHDFEIKQQNFDITTELPCLSDLKNSGQYPDQAVLMILSYGFLKFLYYLGFQSQGIYCWYSYWATSFRWLQKSGSTFGFRGFWGHPNKVAQYECQQWILRPRKHEYWRNFKNS